MWNLTPDKLKIGHRYIIASVDQQSDWYPVRHKIIGLTVEITEQAFCGVWWRPVDWPFVPGGNNYSSTKDSYCMYSGTYAPVLDIDPAVFAAWCQRDQEDSDE